MIFHYEFKSYPFVLEYYLKPFVSFGNPKGK